MPKNKNEWSRNKAEGQEEKFRTFFTNSVIDIPDAMARRDDEEPESRGLLSKLFHRKDKEKEAPAEQPDDTGEIFIGDEYEEPVADLELAAQSAPAAQAAAQPKAAAPAPAEPEPEEDDDDDDDYIEIAIPVEPEAAKPAAPAAHAQPAVTGTAAPVSVKQPAPAVSEAPKPAVPAPVEKPAHAEKPLAEPAAKPTTPAAQPEQPPKAPEKPAAPAKKAEAPRQVVRPEEDQESQQLAELKAMLERMSAERSAAAKAAEDEARRENAARQRASATKPKAPAAPVKPVVQPKPAEPEKPAAPKKAPVSPTGMLLFGEADAETAHTPEKEDTMSIPLDSGEAETPVAPAAEAAPAQPDKAAEPASKAEVPAEAAVTPEAEAQPEAEEPEPDTPEAIAARLKQMSASLTLRCAISGVLALVLLVLGLSSEGLISPIGGLDPVVAPAAFYAANLLLYAAAMFVGQSVIRDGLAGVRGRPSAETMPALASVAAAVQAVIALLNPHAYAPSSLSLLSGVASLGLFMALLGNRVMLAAVCSGFELISSGLEHEGAYRLRDKDAIRSLARDLEEKDPWVLVSSPIGWEKDFVEQCFGPRSSERRARKVSLALLGMAVLSGLLFLIFGAGFNGMAAAATAVLCMGAPLSSTLIAGITSLRLQRSAGAVGAMVPGWSAIEELGGIDTVQATAEELFTPECVSLEDIRIFKGGRIDLAILYAASVLNPCCATLRGLFRQIIEDRTDLLFPIKDLEIHHELGFSAWCDNNRILIGTREYMEQEEVPLPEQEYEDKHSRNGELQILYLAVSGNLHAMFVLRYQGGRNAARGMAVLQKENIRLLVSCQDPSLTARHIANAYHLPDWMVTLLDGDQCAALEAQHKPDDVQCCMVHLKGFASLTGGLRAAEQAQNAETSATTVQIVSVLFSVVIALLLTSAGSIGSLSVATVLMYQAAWSALSIAVCALKQRG